MTSRQNCAHGTPSGSKRDIIECETSGDMFGL